MAVIIYRELSMLSSLGQPFGPPWASIKIDSLEIHSSGETGEHKWIELESKNGLKTFHA